MSEKRAERLQVMLTQEEVSAVDEWRFENRMPSRSAAARALMNLGLNSVKQGAGTEELLNNPVASGDIGIVDLDPVVEDALTSAGPPAILLVDADILVARGIGSLLGQSGYNTIGPAATADEALALTRENTLGGAVLETHLGSDKIEKLADELTRQQVPFLFCSAHDPRTHLAERFWSVPVVAKSRAMTDLMPALAKLVSLPGGNP
ncbi:MULTISPECIES: hypothetical protein [Kordiimonas]|uniref:hypothetical protein n=1 Tax=Kordiimonas TaxID=288021 RepID=UPI00257B8A37|nr:hypothetical protein [Kordiimonas sp. UBA4487]